MRKPSNNANITVSNEIHERLRKIKEHNNWTYTETIDKLCELYLEDNKIEFTVSYELHLQEYSDSMIYNKVYPFIIRFGNDNFTVEYENEDHTTTYDITEWNVNQSVRNNFYEFINKDCARCLLLHMPLAMMFEDFEIYKLNTTINS